MNSALHPRLARLDALAASLADSPDVVAVLGLGSAGIDHARFDDHSDIDFFVVVDDVAARDRLLSDLGWLTAVGTMVHCFANDPHSRKALFADGLFVEFAVFTPDELSALPLAGGRIVWQRTGNDLDLSGAAVPPATAFDTVEFHVNEALGNLFVGLHRELRGERLSATRFIQVFAVDRVLALARLTDPGAASDPFDATRRIESAHPELTGSLREMLRGYDDNADAARAVLQWLTGRFPTEPAITGPIRVLITRAGAPRPDVRTAATS